MIEFWKLLPLILYYIWFISCGALMAYAAYRGNWMEAIFWVLLLNLVGMKS